MSLASWKREFYPITAKQAAKQGDLAAAEHSLKKWEGALPENAKRHGVIVDGIELLANGRAFSFVDKTCALCERHASPPPFPAGQECEKCPLGITLGRPCAGWDDEPYGAMESDSNPRPMIAALRKTVKRLRGRK